MQRSKQKAIALLVVLGTFVILMLIASLVMTMFLSHFRLTWHSVIRTQALYAAEAGIIYAFEKLRLNNDPAWPEPKNRPERKYTHSLCNAGIHDPDCVFTDDTFPVFIKKVRITVVDKNCTSLICSPPNAVGICIRSNVDYAVD